MIGSTFQCNICGSESMFNPQDDWRETPSCTTCGSSVRMRSLIHVLTMRLFEESRVLAEMEPQSLTGLGMSDWAGYADQLERIFNYTNTYYHTEPLMDIVDPGPRWTESSDFLISSDVFEHVLAPVSRAFTGAYDVLKPGGLFVLTVPYGDNTETIEHYGDAVDLKVVEIGGGYAVVTKTSSGEVKLDPDPVFHGGLARRWK